MKMRSNPTDQQLARRMRRPPEFSHDTRFLRDAYWALRQQGYPHSYAKRALRDQLPIIHEHTASESLGEYACDPDELLFPERSTWTEIEVEIRPELSEEAIPTLKPRTSEYTVWDNLIPRFGVRVRPSGHMTYIVNYRIRYQTKLHKHTIGLVAEFSLEQARSVAREFRRNARMGIDPVKRMREHAKGL
jgi:hypothetical protein